MIFSIFRGRLCCVFLFIIAKCCYSLNCVAEWALGREISCVCVCVNMDVSSYLLHYQILIKPILFGR